MKIIVSQKEDQIVIVNDGLYLNVGGAEVDDVKFFSVGVGDTSFGLYRKHADALKEMREIAAFLVDYKTDSYRLKVDE